MSTDSVSSEESTAIEEMDRDDLEDEVRDLRERLDDLEERVADNESGSVPKTTVNHLVEALVTDIDIEDYRGDPFRHKAAVSEASWADADATIP